MNKKSGRDLLTDAFRRNIYDRLLTKYIDSCRPSSEEEDTRSSRVTKKNEGRFPNLAGFCRFLRMGTEDLIELSEEFPAQVAYIYAVLEDEALNSSVSPTLLTAYLKRRLGYDRNGERGERSPCSEALPMIQFEHDIYGDGE